MGGTSGTVRRYSSNRAPPRANTDLQPENKLSAFFHENRILVIHDSRERKKYSWMKLLFSNSLLKSNDTEMGAKLFFLLPKE